MKHMQHTDNYIWVSIDYQKTSLFTSEYVYAVCDVANLTTCLRLGPGLLRSGGRFGRKWGRFPLIVAWSHGTAHAWHLCDCRRELLTCWGNGQVWTSFTFFHAQQLWIPTAAACAWWPLWVRLPRGKLSLCGFTLMDVASRERRPSQKICRFLYVPLGFNIFCFSFS